MFNFFKKPTSLELSDAVFDLLKHRNIDVGDHVRLIINESIVKYKPKYSTKKSLRIVKRAIPEMDMSPSRIWTNNLVDNLFMQKLFEQ